MRAILTMLAVFICHTAVAADLPPTLAVGKVENGNLITTVYKQVPVVKTVTVKKVVDGKEVLEQVAVQVLETVQEQVAFSLKGAKATVGGKAVSEKELAELLSKEAPIVTNRGPIPAKFKAVFKDDVILIEFPEPKSTTPKKKSR